MNIKKVKEELRHTVESYLLKDHYGNYQIPVIRQRPVVLMGPPGVGKTQIMEQVARECGVGFVSYTITHHTRQSAVGLPFIVERKYSGKKWNVTEYTMSEIVASIYNKIESSGLTEGILFIDEINCVSETLAPTMLQFLQNKMFGTHKIPDGWVIMAAGNPPEYNKSVRDFDVVTLDRIKMIAVEADYNVWKEYAYEAGIHPAVMSYLNAKSDNFFKMETTVDGKLFVTPRGWEDLSCVIQVCEMTGKPVERELVSQYLQYPVIAKDFANYIELYYKYEKDYQVDEVLKGIIKEQLCNHLKRAAFDERLSVIGILLAKLTEGFRKTFLLGKQTENLMNRLKRVKPEPGKEQDSEAVFLNLQSATEQLEQEWSEKKQAGLLNRMDDALYQDVLKLMESYVMKLQLEDEEHSGGWKYLQELFQEQSESYNRQFEDSQIRLEHGMDFMEAAFGSGQEMVIFITELNTNYFAVEFLKEYDCQRYYQYNRELLFRQNEDRIIKKIHKLS